MQTECDMGQTSLRLLLHLYASLAAKVWCIHLTVIFARPLLECWFLDVMQATLVLFVCETHPHIRYAFHHNQQEHSCISPIFLISQKYVLLRVDGIESKYQRIFG